MAKPTTTRTRETKIEASEFYVVDDDFNYIVDEGGNAIIGMLPDINTDWRRREDDSDDI